MTDRFGFQTRKPRRLPEVDPAVRRRFESMELGRRRPGERLLPPRSEDAQPLLIPRGESVPPEHPHRFRWTAAVLGVLTVAVVVHGIFSGRPLWTVQEVRVEGNRAAESETILATLGFAPGMPWWRALTADRAALLDNEPRVRSVALRYRFPQGLAVRINERVPVLRWLGDPVRMVAEDGTLLAGISGLDPSDVPCLSAPGIDPGLPGRRVQFPESGDWWEQLLRLKKENADLWATISQVQYEGERRFRVFFRDPKRVVVWDPYLNGHLWERVPMVFDDLLHRGLGADAVLDLRFRDRIVVRVPEEEWQRLERGDEPGHEPGDEPGDVLGDSGTGSTPSQGAWDGPGAVGGDRGGRT